MFIKKINKTTILRWSKTAAIYIGIIFAINWWQGRDLLPTGSDSAAPGFDLAVLGQEDSIHIGQFADDQLTTKQQKTILFFFAPWCTVCSLNADNVNMLLERNSGAKDVRILAVALSYSNQDAVEKYVKEHDLKVPVLLGTDRVRESYKISAYPTFYILDENAAVRSKATGYTTFLGLLTRQVF